MKKDFTELVFILDRSGSMSGLEGDTIAGFNAMITRQKALPGSAVVTTVLFDNQYELLHDRIDIHALTPLTDHDYYVRGCTALLDAVGQTINKVINTQKHTVQSMRAQKVIFVITTDGFENASRHFSHAQIRRMIEYQKKRYGWEFIFLGANMDAVSEARKIGIDENRASTYKNTHKGVQVNYTVMSEAISMMRKSSAPIGAEWKSGMDDIS